MTVVAIDEFCYGAGVNNGVQGHKAGGREQLMGIEKALPREDLPARPFRNVYAEKGFVAFSELCTFGNKAETVKVHVRAADDDDNLFLGADQVVFDNVALCGCQRESTGRLGYRPRFCSKDE
jgi:hypothetical protein